MSSVEVVLCAGLLGNLLFSCAPKLQWFSWRHKAGDGSHSLPVCLPTCSKWKWPSSLTSHLIYVILSWIRDVSSSLGWKVLQRHEKQWLNKDFWVRFHNGKSNGITHLDIQWLSKMVNKNTSFFLPHRIQVLVYNFTSKNFFSSNFKLHIWITCPCWRDSHQAFLSMEVR